MADNYKHEDWELRSFSSGKLKKSSSVEILLGTHPTRGRLLASPRPSPSTRVTTHKMNGSGRPTSTGKADTLPPSAAAPSVPVPNRSVEKVMARDSETVPPTTVPHTTVSPISVPGKDKDLAVTPELTGSNSALQRVPETPLTPPPLNTVPLTSTPKDTTTPQASLNTTPQPPPLRNVKDKGSHLPPLVTTRKPEHQSPMSTPRVTPKGTPIIGKRGHVFSVSSPEVEPDTGQPLLPLPLEVKAKKTAGDGTSHPFELRRKTKPVPEAEERKDGGGGGGGAEGGGARGGEGEGEPVWQRRLSLLFIPPTEDELEPEKEVEETARLLPITITRHILRKQSFECITTPPLTRRGDREDRANKRKHREEKESQRRKEEEEKKNPPRQSRINFEEERNKKREEEKRRKEKEEDWKVDTTKFSRLRRSSISDDPPSSSSSMGSSDEEEREEEEEGEGRGDDYTSWDDTICSNRSAYFKKYYNQRGVTETPAEEKDDDFRSPFEASQNSLSSLIREKMGKSAPTLGKRPSQIGLMVLVVVLLIVIVVGVSLTHYFYHLHLLELSIFNRIKFYEGPRHLEAYDPTWKPILALHLGTNLPTHSIPEDCTDYLHYLKAKNASLPHHGLDDHHYEEMICLDWTGLAQVHLRKLYSAGSVQCYTVWWVALMRDFTLRDCLMTNTSDTNARNMTWWGGGEMTSGGYPITRGDVPPVSMVTSRLERDPWGQLLRRTWLSDRATLLMLPATFRGRVSVNHRLDREVCLERHVTAGTTADPNLSYTLCTAPNFTALSGYLHQRAVQKRRVVGLAVPALVNYTTEPLEEPSEDETPESTVLREMFSPEVVARVEERLEHPVWVPWMTPDSPALTQEAVLQYVHRLANSSGGHVLLQASWQPRPGQLEFDPDRFPDPATLSRTIRDKGLHLTLTLHPFVSVDAPGFGTGMREGLWVRQRNSVLPALARYDEHHPSVVTDFTNPRARTWYAEQLHALTEKYGVDRFHLQPADAHALPTYHDHHTPLSTSDDTLIQFMASVSSVSPPISTEGAVSPPLPPTFVTLGTGDGSWSGLETLVPRALTLTMLGFPFLDVGPIGGLARAAHVPDRELYIRWIEAAAFLPAMQISVLPSTYGHEVEELAKEYEAMRKEHVLPRLLEKVDDALELGTPLITPLALFDPDDPEAVQVDDQWVLGDDLLVAPVTRRGQRTRDFYLPKGIWKDGIDGHLRNGGRWVKNYKVPLTKIPHFFLRYVDDFET